MNGLSFLTIAAYEVNTGNSTNYSNQADNNKTNKRFIDILCTDKRQYYGNCADSKNIEINFLEVFPYGDTNHSS